MTDLDILATAYGLLGESLHASGLVGDAWQRLPRRELPRDISSQDLDVIDLHLRLRVHLSGYAPSDVLQAASRGLEAVRALPSDENTGNYILVAVHLLSLWASQASGPFAAIVSTQSTRLLDAISPHVREEVGDDTARQSYRIADNLYRAMTGRPILDNAIRDAWSGRWLTKRQGDAA